MEQADASFALSLKLLMGAVAAGVLVGMGMGLYVARSIAVPLRAIALAADGIADSDLDQQIDLERHDEAGRAAAAFRRRVAYLGGIVDVAAAMAEGDLSRAQELAATAEYLKTPVSRFTLVEDRTPPAAGGLRQPLTKTLTALRRAA